MKKKNVLTSILLCLILLTVCFIFSNSMESIPDSRTRSEGLLTLLRPLLEFFVGKGNATNHLIRKLAHFAEFFALGAELSALCLLWSKPLLWTLFAGLLTALTDETIQIFYGRGSQVQDVWLDFSAVIFSVLLAFSIRLLYSHKTKDQP